MSTYGEKFDKVIPTEEEALRFLHELEAFCDERGVDGTFFYFVGDEFCGFTIQTNRTRQFLMQSRASAQVKPQ